MAKSKGFRSDCRMIGMAPATAELLGCVHLTGKPAIIRTSPPASDPGLLRSKFVPLQGTQVRALGPTLTCRRAELDRNCLERVILESDETGLHAPGPAANRALSSCSDPDSVTHPQSAHSVPGDHPMTRTPGIHDIYYYRRAERLQTISGGKGPFQLGPATATPTGRR